MKMVFHASAGDYEAELEEMKVLSVTPLDGGYRESCTLPKRVDSATA